MDKMKCSFLQAEVVSILLYGCTTSTLTKRMEKACQQLRKNAASNVEQVLEAAPYKAAAVPNTHHKNYPSWTNQACVTLLEK